MYMKIELRGAESTRNLFVNFFYELGRGCAGGGKGTIRLLLPLVFPVPLAIHN